MQQPPDIAVAILKSKVRRDLAELCEISYIWRQRDPGVVLRFLDSEPELPFPRATYRQVSIELPEAGRLSISMWERQDPDDRVLILKRVSSEAVDHIVYYIGQNPYADCRMLSISTRDGLRNDLDQIMRMGFVHLPIYGSERVHETAIRCINRMNRKRIIRSTPVDRRTRATSMLSPTFQGRDVAASADSFIGILRNKGRPLLFEPPFYSYGFVINPQVAVVVQEGVEVSAKSGLALHGPFIEVPPGRYAATLTIENRRFAVGGSSSMTDMPEGHIVVDAYVAPDSAPLGEVIVAAASLGPRAYVEIEFEIAHREQAGKLEIRVHQNSDLPFVISAIELTWLE